MFQADILPQKAVEKGSCLSAGDVAERMNAAVGISVDIGNVIVGEQRVTGTPGVVDGDAAVFARGGRMRGPVELIALGRCYLDPVVVAALGDPCLYPAGAIGLIRADLCVGRVAANAPQLEFRAAKRRIIPGVALGEMERVADIGDAACTAACPLTLRSQTMDNWRVLSRSVSDKMPISLLPAISVALSNISLVLSISAFKFVFTVCLADSYLYHFVSLSLNSRAKPIPTARANPAKINQHVCHSPTRNPSSVQWQ